MKKLSAGAIALVLLLSAPLWGDPVAHSATSLSKTVKRALGLAKKADRRSRLALIRANRALAQGGPTGPAGAPGAAGSPGPVGPAGPAGAIAQTVVRKVAATLEAAEGSVATAVATCEPGERLVSGGFGANTVAPFQTLQDRPEVNGAIPEAGQTPNGWRALVRRTTASSGSHTLSVYAVCAS